MPRCRHNLEICSRCVVITDAAKRMADAINLMVTFKTWEEVCNGYMAFRLSDGSTNMVLYDSHTDAARHTDEKQHGYFCLRNGMGGANAKDCQILLNVWRAAADAGIPMAEPNVRRQPNLIISTWGYDVMSGRVDPRYRP
jgi:hypothetical protein